jgi:hypothetical protein
MDRNEIKKGDNVEIHVMSKGKRLSTHEGVAYEKDSKLGIKVNGFFVGFDEVASNNIVKKVS